VGTCLGNEPTARAKELVEKVDLIAMEAASKKWWQDYWSAVPTLTIPDGELTHAYLHGLFLQAGLTPPEGMAATLTGAWMEEHLMPPWSNDYHFNINVQMIYWSCLATNRMEHLNPLWEILLSWMPQMKASAVHFFEDEDAVMLPHAVNDHGMTGDNFWAGMIDHGCCAWTAQMAWLHYRHSMDERVLRDVAWPLLVGAFNGYWAMAEEIPDGKGGLRFSLPITVSPEFGGSGAKSWGRDASFQLAAWHMVAQILPKAAARLGKKEDPRWEQIRQRLPAYTTIEGGDVWNLENKTTRMALWEGQDLTESHRHHSLLAGIYPFTSFDPAAPEHRTLMARTLEHWVRMGTGLWSGWSLPWAATLASRYDSPDAGIAWLHWWRNVYNNIGWGSDHNADFVGCTVLNRGYFFADPPDKRYRPAIQLDGAMGAITAILEIMVQQRGDTLVVLPRIPRRWREFSFDGIRTEGAFLVSAAVRRSRVMEVTVTSSAGEPLKLAHGLGDAWECDGRRQSGPIFETTTKPGKTFVLKRIAEA
jgi:hypothetical protein